MVMVVGFSRPRKFKMFSWIIMKGYSIPYSHTYIKMYSNTYQRWLVYQASSTMVNFMNIETFNEEAQSVYEAQIEVSQETGFKVMQFAIDNCGKPYGIKGVFGYAWVRIKEIFGRKEENPLTDGNASFVCSELVAEILKECLGAELSKSPENMTPKDIYDLIPSIIKINQ